MSSSTSVSTAVPQQSTILNLSTTFGPLLIGNTVGILLFGILLVQVVWYYMHYSKDPILLKIWVAILVCLGASHESITFLGNYRIFILQFGDVHFILQINKLLVYQTMVTSMVGAMVQCFFIYRIFAFANAVLIKYGIPILLSPLIVWQLVGTSLYVHRATGFKSVLQLNDLREIDLSINGSQCAVDIVIALTMSLLLYTRKTGLTTTDRLLQNLIIASVNTGAWTALLATAVIIAICVSPETDLIYGCPYLMLSSMYINTVLSSLNIRLYLRRRRASDCGEIDIAWSKPPAGRTCKESMPVMSIERDTAINGGTFDSDLTGTTVTVGDHENILTRV